MPAAVPENSNTANEDDPNKAEHSEQMWKILKAHILRERARKKQEREAEVEEERLRKEREAREQQNVMTLGETREQLLQLEAKLQQLRDEKHQLFLTLKRVLNADDNNRKKQMVKETASDILTLQSIPQGLVHQQQVYITPASVPRAPMPQQQPQQGFKPCTKRPRSPSPPPSIPVSLYHQGYSSYKPSVGSTPYQSSPQKDDGRRHELVRAVLWNKTQQPCFYPPSDLSIFYTQPQQGPMPSREPQRCSYEPSRAQTYHLEAKLTDHYGLRPPNSHSHIIHGGALAISSQAPPKTGSIATGYPVRSQTQYQQVPTAAPALYTAQNRPLYQSPGTPMSYSQRE
ncbi:G protein pathway suppressor 2 isoform X2 [Harmonia axyridis]|uniref:G protein pathway suppressor 2 isoform X2 n=1 Tax=Harmonia axyridis TaxID=115357 RepID=UPI001E275E2B|nr:G protein pathway suppressor 2 isoform X2 [Harmonia axyridis]